MSSKTKKVKEQEKEIYERVRDHFSQAKIARQNGCYWSSSGGESGSDWLHRWDLQEKIDLMDFEKPSADQFLSNVKSPMTTGRIDAVMSQFKKLNLQYVVRPLESNDSQDKARAKVVQQLLNTLFRKANFRSHFHSWVVDALVHGTSFMQVYYLRKSRSVKMTPKNSKDLSSEERQMLKESNGKARVYRNVEHGDYNDIALEPCKLTEIYVDPSARYLHGESYEAQWVFRRMLPSYDQCMAVFNSDPDAKNLDKIKRISAYTQEEREHFAPPTDVIGEDYVEVLHYYNKAEDRYVVIANDVIVKDMPLPYNHKQLPFVAISPVKRNHQLYGIGIVDRMLALQTEEEILKNTIYDRLHITANPMLKVKAPIYGEFSKAYRTAEPGKMLPVKQQDDVMPLDYPPLSFDMFKALELLDRDAVIASQIDPVQMGVSQRYVAATTSMMSKEQRDAYINSLVDEFTEALTVMGYQIVSLMKQFYTAKDVGRKIGNKPDYRRMLLEGIEINPKTMEIVQKKKGEYSYVDIKPEYFEISGDWDISIAPESVEVVSRAIEMQKSQANLAQLAPFMVDPTDQQKIAMHPTPWINGPGMLEWYAETNNIPNKLLVNLVEEDDISARRAEEQGKKLLMNEEVPGIPGENDIHKRVHVEQLHAQNDKVMKLEEKIATYGPNAEMYLDLLPEGKQLLEAKDIAVKMAEHLKEDDQPRMAITQLAISKTQQQIQGPQVPMPPGLTPAGSGQPPMPMAGNQMNGMEAAGQMGEPMMGGMGGQTGRPPMAMEGGMQ